MYLLIGFLVALGSVFVPSLVGALLIRKETVKTLIIAGVATVVYGVVVWLIMWGFRADIYGPTPLFGAIIIGSVISAIICGNTEENFFAALPGILIAVVLFICIIVVAISGSDMNKSTEKGKLLPVEVKKIDSKIMELADPAHICLVDEPMAFSKAEKILGNVITEDNANAGSRYEVKKGTKQFVDGQFWWIFPLEFRSYWQWSSYPTVPAYIRVSAEDTKAIAQVVQTDKNGQPIVMKYLNSACFDYLAERYLRKNGYLKSNIDDFTFEVDDNWRPYYTISQCEWTIGYGGDINTNVLIFDVQTGDVESCPIKEAPTKFPWIDRAANSDVIEYQAIKWGEYEKVAWKLTSRYNGKRQKPTDGWFMTYDRGRCYWFTGWTSYSSSSDLIGLSMTDAVTGKTIYYPTTGCTEAAAYKAAKGLWKNFPDYECTELVPYNIYGMLTYVIAMKYDNNFYGVSLVSVLNKDISAKGNTLEEALSTYRSAIASATSDRGVPYEGQPQKLSITAKIAEVGMPFIQGTNQMYPFTLTGIDKIFQVNYTLQNAKISFLKPGREVVITYMDTKEKVITCLSFDIPEIRLTDQNPAQARWLENQQEVKKEETRINNVQENQFILETEDLSKVNPDSLKKFIESQKKK